MMCHGSSVGCAGLELVAYHHALPSSTVAASIYTVSHVPPSLLQLSGEAPQVVIEASHSSKDSYDSGSQRPPPHISKPEQALSSIYPSASAADFTLQRVLYQDLVDFLMSLKRRFTIIIAAVIASWWGLDTLHTHLDPNSGWKGEEEKEEASWIASSHSTIDRAACRWLGVCGISHIAIDPSVGLKPPNRKAETQQKSESASEKDTYGSDSNLSAEDLWRFQDNERVLKDVPQYVLDYAPLVHLYSGEQFWPCDINEHLAHTTPHLNYTTISSEHTNVQDLDSLNDLDGGRYVFLKSDDNVQDRPDWLGGAVNIPAESESGDMGSSWAGGDDWDEMIDGPKPDDNRDAWAELGIDSTVTLGGLRPEPDSENPLVPSQDEEGDKLLPEYDESLREARRKLARLSRRRKPYRPYNEQRSFQAKTQHHLSPGGRSSAPAVLILVEKSPEIIDAFWFYFYSYNLGNTVLNVRFGNHVGDWEHSLVRFENGIPRVVFFSEHAGGKAYTYDAVEKIGTRPVIYSAEGTHAMYATPGIHPYILPGGMLKDVTDKGPLWDPALNLYSYYYNYTQDIGTNPHDNDEEKIFSATSLTPRAPTNWFWFRGHWGDKFYQLSDRRQYRFLKQYHYVNGPLGPRFKHLGRRRVCQGNGGCEIQESIGGKL